MSELFKKNIETRISILLDDLNNIIDSVVEAKTCVYTINYLLQAREEETKPTNKSKKLKIK